MKYKKGLIFICLIICLFSIASVCASEGNETAVTSECHSIDINDTFQINEDMNEIETNESNDVIFNEMNVTVEETPDQIIGKNELLSARFDNDVLTGEYDWIYVADATTKGIGSNIPIYVAESATGFVLKDGQMNYERYFTKHSDGSFHPDCYAEDYLLPTTFHIENDLYILTNGPGDTWYYKRWSYPPAKSSIINVENYDFQRYSYPYVGSGSQYSTIKIPISVFDSQGNYALGGVVITDSNGGTVGYSHLNSGMADVEVSLKESGKNRYKVQFNSANENQVASSSKYFYITSIPSNVTIIANGLENRSTIVSYMDSKFSLDIYVIGAYSGYVGVLIEGYNSVGNFPLREMHGYGLGGRVDNFSINTPSEEGTYNIVIMYSMESTCHGVYNDVNLIWRKDLKLEVINYYKETMAITPSVDSISGKAGSTLEFDINVTRMVNPTRVYTDPIDYFREKVPHVVNEGYISVMINNKEYRFQVNNSIAHVILPLNNYLSGYYDFIYKKSEGYYNGFSTSVYMYTLPFNYINLTHEDIVIGSDSILNCDIGVFGDQYYINDGKLILDIIDNKTGDIFQSFTSNVAFGKATFNITVPEVIHDYNYRIRYTGFPSKNNTAQYLNVYDYREYSLKSYLLDENSNNISSVTGKYSGNSTFKIKVTDNLNEVNNNLVKLIIGSHEYVSVIKNNEANFNFKNEYYDKDCILMYYVVDGIEFFVKSIPYNVVEKDIIISLNETDFTSEFSAIKNVEINVIDEFGNPVSGKIQSNLDGLIYNVNNDGKGVLTIKDKSIGNYIDTLTFKANGCKITNYTYTFELTKATAEVKIENNEIEVKIGNYGNDLIAFNLSDKNNNQSVNFDTLNISNDNFTIIPSSDKGKYFLKVPDKIGVYNLTITGNDEKYYLYYEFTINITKIKPTLITQPTSVITQNVLGLDFYYLNNNINEYINGNLSISINDNNKTYECGKPIKLDLPNKLGIYQGVIKFEGTDKCLAFEQEFSVSVIKSDSYFKLNPKLNKVDYNSNYISVTSSEFYIYGDLYYNATFENISDINIIINDKTYNVSAILENNHLVSFKCLVDINEIHNSGNYIDGKMIFKGSNFINSSNLDFKLILYKKSQEIVVNNVGAELGDNITISGRFNNVLSEFKNYGNITILIDNVSKFDFEVNDYQFSEDISINLSEGSHKCIAIFHDSILYKDCNTTFQINVYKPKAIISLNNTNISKMIGDVFENITVYVFDKFGNPLNGTISSSKYHDEFNITNGCGILQIIFTKYLLGDFEDTLIFNGRETRQTEFKYSFNVRESEGFFSLEKYEVNVGDTDRVPFKVLNKFGDNLNSIFTLTADNDEFNFSSQYLFFPNKVGEYNLTITGISSSKTCKNFTTSVLFKVNKRLPSLSLGSQCIIGQNKYLSINLKGSTSYFKGSVEGNVTLLVNGVEYSFYYNDSSQQVLLTLPDVEGMYSGYLKYHGSQNFKPLEKNFTVNVDKGSTSLKLTSSSEINSEIITISGYLKCDDSLFKNSDNIKLFLENNQYPVEIISKVYDTISFKSTVNLSGILSSKINGKVVFEETDYLKSSSYGFDLYLTKKPQKLNIPNIVVELGKDIDIVGVFENIREGFKNDGEIYIDVTNDYKIFRIDTNGNYTIIKTIPSFYSVGTYNCYAKFYNSKLFDDCETWFNITVTQPKDYSVDITANVVVKDDNYLNGADINIKLSQNIDVKANVILNNQKISTINIVAGAANTHVNNLIVGGNTVKIELDDKDYHGSCIKTFDAHEILSNDKIDIKLPEANSNDNSIVINLPNDANGEIILTINNQEYKFKVENGVSNVKLPDLKNGNYDYTITYSGDGKYSAFSKSSNLIINKILKTQIIAKNIVVVFRSDKYIDISLRDSEGKPVANVDILININGETTVLGLDSFGKTSYSTDLLKPKTYKAIITFKGNSKYEKSTASVKVIVKKATPKLAAKAKTFKKSVKTKKYWIILKTNQNKVMKNTKVYIKVNKKTYVAKTNKKGVATFKITKLTKKGKYIATVTYKGSAYYNKVTKKVIIKVK